jgi:hypothetical protein
VELPRPLAKLGLVRLFEFYPFTVHVQKAARLPGPFFLLAIYSTIQ